MLEKLDIKKLMEDEFSIYKIYCQVNQKTYIGQTNYPERRWSQHKWLAKHNPNEMVLTRAMAKHGIDNFTFEVIANAKSREDINHLEKLCIEQYDSLNPKKGYNVDFGGGVDKRSPETLEKISKSLRKFYDNNPSKALGRKHSEESKKKISESSMGKAGTNTGKKFDEGWKLGIAKGNAGSERKKLRRFNDEVEVEICRLYVEKKLSMKAIAKIYDCYPTLVDDLLLRNNIEKRPSYQAQHAVYKVTVQQEEEICKIYVEGKTTIKALAEKFGFGKTTIRDILIRNNVKL